MAFFSFSLCGNSVTFYRCPRSRRSRTYLSRLMFFIPFIGIPVQFIVIHGCHRGNYISRSINEGHEMWVRVFGKGSLPLRVNVRVTVRIEACLRAELIKAKIIWMISIIFWWIEISSGTWSRHILTDVVQQQCQNLCNTLQCKVSCIYQVFFIRRKGIWKHTQR